MKRKFIDIDNFLKNKLAWVLLIIICLAFMIVNPNFMSTRNILNILNQNA